MRFSIKALGCAMAVSLALTPVMSMAWEKDKTYAITILHTNDHHGHFWHNDHGEYGLAAQKRWSIRFVRKWRVKAAACCCFPAVILILACLSPTCRMRSPIFVV